MAEHLEQKTISDKTMIKGQWAAWGFFAALASVGLPLVLWWTLLMPPSSVIAPTLVGDAKAGQEIYRLAGIWRYDHPHASEQRWGQLLRDPVSQSWLVAYLRAPRHLGANKTMLARPELLERDEIGRWKLRKEGEKLLAYLNRQAELEHRDGLTELERTQASSIRIRLDEGKRLYRRLCASCHGNQGEGGGALMRKLGKELPDLREHRNILCRTSRLPSVDDLTRTLKRGVAHAGMMPLGRTLQEWQIASLAEYFRQLIHLDQEGEPSHYLAQLKTYPPSYRELQRKDFRDWFEGWWKARYQAWLAKQPEDSTLRQYAFPAWKEMMEWQLFSQWLRSDPRRLHLSRADWEAFLMKKFTKEAEEWRKSKVTRSFSRYLMRVTRKRFDQERRKPKKEFALLGWIKVKASRTSTHAKQFFGSTSKPVEDPYARKPFNLGEYNGWLQGQGYRDYLRWREDTEREAQRKWRDQQHQVIFRAWQGKKLFQDLGCASCHGKEGEGSIIHIPISAKKDEKHLKEHRVPSLREGALRCGTGYRDVMYATLAGPHMALLDQRTQEIHARRVPIPIAQPQQKTSDVRLEALITYVRFLARDLPLARPVTHP